MHEGTRSTRRWRLATLLALGVVIGVLVSATPAGAHFQASINHIWSHIKPKADARYLQNTKTIIVLTAGRRSAEASTRTTCSPWWSRPRARSSTGPGLS